jgi:hypothetical protein
VTIPSSSNGCYADKSEQEFCGVRGHRRSPVEQFLPTADLFVRAHLVGDVAQLAYRDSRSGSARPTKVFSISTHRQVPSRQ